MWIYCALHVKAFDQEFAGQIFRVKKIDSRTSVGNTKLTWQMVEAVELNLNPATLRGRVA
jgi:hypothetical protein